MKKFAYIFILIVLIGIFSIATKVDAGTCRWKINSSIYKIGDLVNVSEERCKQNTNNYVWNPNEAAPAPQPTTVTPNKNYNFLAPLPCADGTPGCKNGELATFNPAPTNNADNVLGGYLNMMINLFIGICAVLAVVMIVVGGIEYMASELPGNKESGKERITNAIFGLILALGSWALLNTINPDLLNTNIKIKNASIAVDLEDNLPQIVVNGKYKNGVVQGTPWTGTATPLPVSVTLNGSQCTRVGDRGCTSTFGLNMSQVQAIQQGCGCPLVITGGTEWWLHGGQSGSTTHQSGSSTVDLRTDSDPNNPLNKYLSGGKPLVRMQRYPDPNGPYLYEGNHWHIGR